jgi:hypothetical protein
MRVEFLTPLRGSLFIGCSIPTAHAVGYILSPLTGLISRLIICVPIKAVTAAGREVC